MTDDLHVTDELGATDDPAQPGDPELYEIDADPERVDLDVIWGWLSTEAYWSQWRTRRDVETQVANAWRVVGAYRRSDGAMVGFARAISDGVSQAYLADVFVLPVARGLGLSKRILAEMLEPAPGNMFRWSLHTRDAHSLYQQFGFAAPDQKYLERPATR